MEVCEEVHTPSLPTSESDLSAGSSQAGQSLYRPAPVRPNCATYHFQHVSEDEDEDEEDEEDISDRTVRKNGGALHREEELYLEEETADCLDNMLQEQDDGLTSRGLDALNGNQGKYLRFTYTHQQIYSLAEQAEQLVLKTRKSGPESSCNASGEDESDDYNESQITKRENVVFNKGYSSSQRIKSRRRSSYMTLDLTNYNKTLSMDVSSPESVNSLNISLQDSMTSSLRDSMTSSLQDSMTSSLVSSPDSADSLYSPDTTVRTGVVPPVRGSTCQPPSPVMGSTCKPPFPVRGEVCYPLPPVRGAEDSPASSVKGGLDHPPSRHTDQRSSYHSTPLNLKKGTKSLVGTAGDSPSFRRSNHGSNKCLPSSSPYIPPSSAPYSPPSSAPYSPPTSAPYSPPRIQESAPDFQGSRIQLFHKSVQSQGETATLLNLDSPLSEGVWPLTEVSTPTLESLDRTLVPPDPLEGADPLLEEELSVEDNSLDDISSGEMEEYQNKISDNDIWDQESYVSEYNYDESIDEERTRKLLNFGDDYRNYISSLSSSQSSVNSRTNRRRQRKYRGKVHSIDSGSEAEYSSVYSVLLESGKEYTSVDNRARDLQSTGFPSTDQYTQYTELLSICGENIVLLVDLLNSVDFKDPFLPRRNGREIRILLNRWNKLKERIQDGLHKSSTYSSIREDIEQFRKELRELASKVEEPGSQAPGSSDPELGLEDRLNLYKDCMLELSGFKNTMFNLNLSVHNLLAEVCSTAQASTQGHQLEGQVAQSRDLQAEVVQLYTIWDSVHHRISSGLNHTEDSLRKLSAFETELLELQSSLKKDTQVLRQQRRTRGKQHAADGAGMVRGIQSTDLRGRQGGEVRSKHSSTDSGISDSYDVSEQDLRLKEEKLNRLRLIARSLEDYLTPNCESILLISSTLDSTSHQLNQLKRISRLGRVRSRRLARLEKRRPLLIPARPTEAPRRSRLARVIVVFNLILMVILFLAWAAEPSCCDTYTPLTFTPQLRYINGPPPI